MAYEGPVPRHVAVIMDGNGRWAQARGLDRLAGHEAGAESVRQVVRACGELGVEVLTLYSFSTENWRRPAAEVKGLMALLSRYLKDELAELHGNRVRLRAIGELDQLPAAVRLLLRSVIKATAKNSGLTLVLALSYGSRAEIVNAVRAIADKVKSGRLEVSQIDDKTIGESLYTRDWSDPDLLIRTSGEMRLSNFLLWQCAYAELVVTETAWPDFRRSHLEEAFRTFSARQRRFGRTGHQVGKVG